MFKKKENYFYSTSTCYLIVLLKYDNYCKMFYNLYQIHIRFINAASTFSFLLRQYNICITVTCLNVL